MVIVINIVVIIAKIIKNGVSRKSSVWFNDAEIKQYKLLHKKIITFYVPSFFYGTVAEKTDVVCNLGKCMFFKLKTFRKLIKLIVVKFKSVAEQEN